MERILFVSNGHGESAIAERIGSEVRSLARGPVQLDHLPLVGSGLGEHALRVVGPHRAMPSGGLVAMGNVRALVTDLRAGFVGLLGEQMRFLRGAGASHECAVVVGDAYALALTFLSGLPVAFVGTAKSVYVAPYGPFERTLLRRARRVFVRDRPTAQSLRAARVAAESPGNVIVDLLDGNGLAPPPGNWLGILPGSREHAYPDAVRLTRVVRALSLRHGPVDALLSVAPTVDAARMVRSLAGDGWEAHQPPYAGAFEVRSGLARVLGWSGSLAAMLRACRLVLGQAGTANEQAAACGLPVVTLESVRPEPALAGGDGWYRMRQRRLLGDALATVPADPDAAAEIVAGILADRSQYARMQAAGRERMGGPGGAAAIAQAVLEMA